MKQIKFSAFFLALAITFISCETSNTDATLESRGDTTSMNATETDMTQLKNEIQERETAYAKAESAGDAQAVADFYADDAKGLEENAPMLEGKDAIKKSIESRIAERQKGSVVTYEVMDVYGGGQYVTEVGKSTRTDSTGKVISTGKYMAIWEKRDGQWMCIRDIGNSDMKMN